MEDSGADPALAKAEPVARLGPSGFDPGEMLDALQRIDENLWATSGSRNTECLIACLKEVERLVKPFAKYPWGGNDDSR